MLLMKTFIEGYEIISEKSE